MKKLKNILIIFICFLMFSGFNDETSSFEYIPTYNINNEAAGAFTSSYPTSYDLRGTANNLQVFKNITSESQGSLNICWAFATNNVIEAYMNKIKNNTVTYNYSENQYDYVSRYLGDTKSFGEANTTFNVVKYLFYSVSPMKESDFHSSGYFTNYIEKPLNSYLNLSKSELDISDLKIFSPLDYKGLMNSDKTAEQIEDGMKAYIEPVKEYIYKSYN